MKSGVKGTLKSFRLIKFDKLKHTEILPAIELLLLSDS